MKSPLLKYAVLFNSHKPIIVVAIVLTAIAIGAVFVTSQPNNPIGTGTPSTPSINPSVSAGSQTDAQGREICTSDQPPGAQDDLFFEAEVIKTYGTPVKEYDLSLVSWYPKELNISVRTTTSNGPPITRVCNTQFDITPLQSYAREVRHLDFEDCSNYTNVTEVSLRIFANDSGNWKCKVINFDLYP